MMRGEPLTEEMLDTVFARARELALARHATECYDVSWVR